MARPKKDQNKEVLIETKELHKIQSQQELNMEEKIEIETQDEPTVVETSEVLNPPKSPCEIYKRNNCGLIENLNYEYDEFGLVNWKKLIPKEFLVANRQLFEKRKQEVPKSIEDLKDNELLVLLLGWKKVALFRGYKSIRHKVISASQESVTLKTSIVWRGNYETDFEDVINTSIATASLNNTYSFCKNYLGEIAENRGIVRNVRSFLRIPILGQDELSDVNTNAESEISNSAQEAPSATSPLFTLQNQMAKYNISFEKIKSSCVNKKLEGSSDWKSINDIPVKNVIDIIALVKNKMEKA